MIERPWTDFSQGTLRPTGSPSDLALSGKGFFAVDGPSGRLVHAQWELSAFRPPGPWSPPEGYAVRTVSGGSLNIQPSGASGSGLRRNGAPERPDPGPPGDSGFLRYQLPGQARGQLFSERGASPSRRPARRSSRASWRVPMWAPRNRPYGWWRSCASLKCCRRPPRWDRR